MLPREYSHGYLMRLLELCISRSGRHLLDIAVLTHQSDYEIQQFHQLRDVLLSHSSRWRSMYIDDAAPEYLSQLKQISSADIPNLEKLRITLHKKPHPYEVIDEDILTHLLHTAPSLSEVSVRRLGGRYHVPRLPWTQLKKLSLYNCANTYLFSHDGLLRLFFLCTNLRKLFLTFPRVRRLRISSVALFQDLFEQSVQLPSVVHSTTWTHLTLNQLPPQAVGTCDVLHRLTLPSLRLLELACWKKITSDSEDAQHNIFPTLHALILRSNCPLEKLSLAGIPLPTPHTTECLRLVSTTLRSLTLSRVDSAFGYDHRAGTDHLFSELINDQLCQSLTIFDFQADTDPTIPSPIDVHTMVHSRSLQLIGPVSRLEKVKLRLNRTGRDPCFTQQEVESIRAVGVNLLVNELTEERSLVVFGGTG